MAAVDAELDSAAGGRQFPLWLVCAMLVLLGAALGMWGSFLVPLRLPGGVEGFADILAVGGNVAAGLLAARGTGSVVASAMPGIGWLVTVLVFTGVARPSDEVVIPGRLGTDPGVGTVGSIFLFAGAIGAVAAVLLANRREQRRRELPPG
ncbi:MAG TPA: hypothetical protein VFT62_05305 [Mycobacteriales bacterium]|nr:hypothetical protein [Mycobacteriales bacterium]